jgi:hypothetical protein
MFHLKQRPPDMPRKRKKPASVMDMPLRHSATDLPPAAQPYLEQLNPGFVSFISLFIVFAA